jgi:putative flippase GtrA
MVMIERRFSPKISEAFRYLANGVFATAVHFAVLYAGVELLQLRSAGWSNLIASVFGIGVSFLGNRYFVFDDRSHIAAQAKRFFLVYALIALTHGAVLWLWTDVWHLNYRVGFLIAVAIQVLLGYVASKYWVFTASNAGAQR